MGDLLWIDFLSCKLFDHHEPNAWRWTYGSTILVKVSKQLQSDRADPLII